MEDSRITLNVRMEAAPGREQELETCLTDLVAPTRKEAGCLTYELYRSIEKPGLFAFWEVFQDQQALDAHIASPHFQAFAKHREKSDPLASVQVNKYPLK